MPVYIGFICLVFFMIIQILIFMTRYKSATPDKALVIHGKLDPKDDKGIMVMQSGRIFVWPIVQDYFYQSTDSFKIKLESNYTNAENDELSTTVNLMVKPNTGATEIETYIQNFWQLSTEETSAKLNSEIDVILMQEISEFSNTQTFDKLKETLKDRVQDRFTELGVKIPSSIAIVISPKK